MESAKLDISGGKPVHDVTLSTYKQVPENDLEDEALLSTKSLKKPSSGVQERDGADERMLPDSEKKVSEKSNIDMADVKFVSSDKQNGDAKVDIGDVKTTFVGLGKEELMKYANDPFWVRLRWFLFITFWLTWAAMLIGAILIIVAAPKCSPPEPRTWWEEGPLTEVETDASETTLQNLKDNGIQGVIVTWPNDAYKPLSEEQPFVDFLNKIKTIGINIIVDLKPGISDVWFEKSENESEGGEFNDYYIWAPKKYDSTGTLIEPNNWVSKQNISSWKLSPKRNKYYLSPENLPQLNLSNPNVIDQFSKVITSFLDAGVKGIRITGAPYLLVNPELKDELLSTIKGFIHTDYGFYQHTQTEYISTLGPLLKQWRDILKNKTDNKGVFMVKENLRDLQSFKVNHSLMIDLPVRSRVFSYNKQLNATEINNQFDKAFMFLENTIWPLWQHNTSAFSSDVLDILTLLLPGTALVNQNAIIPKALLEIRKSPSIMFGNTTRFVEGKSNIFAFVRLTPGNPGYLVAFNPTENTESFSLTNSNLKLVEDLTVQLLSSNYNETNVAVKKKISSKNIPISPMSVIVFSYVP